MTQKRPNFGPTTYEYRIWNDAVTISEPELVAFFGKARREARSDIYLPLGQTFMPKIRGVDRLELKVRLDALDGIEVWQRRVSAAFPVGERDLTLFHDCVPDLDLSSGKFRSSELAMIFFAEHFDLVPVKKNRAIYKIETYGRGTAEVELSSVSLLGRNQQTLAVESSDLQTALNLVSELQLGQFENVSYAEWLGRHTE